MYNKKFIPIANPFLDSKERNAVYLVVGKKWITMGKKVNEFGKEIAPLITNGPPGVTGFSGGRPKAQEVIAYWPSLINKKRIETKVDLF